MKSISFIIAGILIVPKLWSMEDGLYDISDSTHPRLIDDLVSQAKIYSESNDNTKYLLDLPARYGFSLPIEKMELICSNRTVPLYVSSEASSGSGFRQVIGLAALVTNLEIVPLIAAHYHTKAVDRHHPRHQMLVQYIPDKEEFSTKEPVMVKMRITNIGKTDFAYWQGSSRSSERIGQFAFSEEKLGDKVLQNVDAPMSYGDQPVFVSLKPGESHELSVDLKSWFNYTAGGIYLIRGSYAMFISNPPSKDNHAGWDDYACAMFEIRIKK